MDKIKVAKELIKLAKSLVANVEVDPYQHRLQELNSWIKARFREEAHRVFDKLRIHNTNQLEQKKEKYNGLNFTYDINSDIEFNKTFVLPDALTIGQNPLEIKDHHLFTLVRVDAKETYFYFKLTLKAKDWYPLFRSCKELTYDDNGEFDKKSFDKLKKSLEKCFEELKI